MTRPPGVPSDAPRRPRLGVSSDRIVAATSVVNLTLAGVWVVLWAALVLTRRSLGADYTAFYTGWRLVLEGQGSRLYDPVAQAAMQKAILGGQTFEAGLNPFNNPPHLVLPFLPLGLLPLEASYLAWAAIQVALVGGIVAMLLRGPARDWSRGERLATVALLLGFPAMGITLWQGAFSLLLVAGVLGTYLAIQAGRGLPAGLGLVLASIKPQGVGGPAVAVLVGRRWRAVLAALVAGGVLAGAATVALGPAIWVDYLRFLSDYASSFDRYSVEPTVMWNLRGTLALLLGHGQAALINAVALAGFAVGMVATAILWRGGWRRDAVARDTAARFGLTIVITLLLSPHLNPHDDLLAVVAGVLAYAAWRDHPRARWLAIALGLAPVVILATNGVDAAAPTTLPVRVPTLLLVALAAVLVAALRRAPDGTNEAAPGAHEARIVP